MRAIYLKIDNIIHKSTELDTVKCNIFDKNEMSNREMASCPALHVVEFFIIRMFCLQYVICDSLNFRSIDGGCQCQFK